MVTYKQRFNITVRRGLDLPLVIQVPLDLTGYSGVCECREKETPTSPLICNLGAVVGSYDSGTGKTPVTLLIPRAKSATITQKHGHWSLVLIDADDHAEAYASGVLTFIDDPSGATSDQT